MKKIMNYAVVLFAGLSVVLSCSKIEKGIDNPVVEPGVENARAITITAILPEADTKVTYDAEYDSDSKPTAVKRNWESTDQLYIWNQDHSSSTILYLDSGDGTNTAVFKGNISFTSPSYDLEVASTAITDYSSQAQACDGDMGHIVFVAGQSGVTDLTAPVTLTETSGVLAIIAQLPDGVAEYVSSVVISDLATGNPVIALTTGLGDTDSDGIFKAYMNVTHGMALGQDEEYLIRFNTPGATQDFYTRYYKVGSDKALGDGKFQYLKLNCKHTDQHAGSPTACDGTSADKAYLIADKYQLAAINSYASTSATTYFKLIDNIDMFGITHNPINTGISGYTINVNFDGNSKTISNLGTSLFYVFKGSINDLTLDKCSVSKRGIFAEYCQGSGNEVTNVTVSNGIVNSSSNNVGGLVGCINESGTSATITNCSVSKTDVSGAGVVGGMIGYADALVNISGCSYSGGTVTASARFSGGLIGNARNYASTFTDCHVSSITVTSSADRVGGLAGQTEKLTAVNNCSSTDAIVTGTINIGGLLGILYGSATDCTSTGGSITSTNTTSNTDIGLGGLAGWLQYGIISHCSSSVSINQTTNGRDIGGLVGKMVDGTIEKSYATG
ncbi:MAG: hypothetical protein II676_01250, partial [Bacteroidales bacterium]|nr:hypothetical protein [Bacteroidales bacterium]